MNELETHSLDRSIAPDNINHILGGIEGLSTHAETVTLRDPEGARLSQVNVVSLRDKQEEFNQVFSIDMDDTTLGYLEAKKAFHKRVATSHYMKEGLDEETANLLCKHINKAARVLPHDKLHPEVYNPTLEILTHTYVIGLLQDQAVTAEEIKEAVSQDKANEWVRQHIIAPMLEESSGLHFNALQVEVQDKNNEGKTYFVQKDDHDRSLATAINRAEIAQLKYLNSVPSELEGVFEEIYIMFQQEMFSPSVFESVIPTPDDGQLFVIATFGEDRFQLIKLRNFLSNLRKKKLRIPDQIWFFDAGRKAPAIRELVDRANRDSEVQVTLIHLDNSANQCKELKALGDPRIHPVHFDLNNDTGESFATLTQHARQ